jgi:hypothetical protein
MRWNLDNRLFLLRFQRQPLWEWTLRFGTLWGRTLRFNSLR